MDGGGSFFVVDRKEGMVTTVVAGVTEAPGLVRLRFLRVRSGSVTGARRLRPFARTRV